MIMHSRHSHKLFIQLPEDTFYLILKIHFRDKIYPEEKKMFTGLTTWYKKNIKDNEPNFEKANQI